MDLRRIKELMELVEGSEISELEVRSGDESIRIVRRPQGGSAVPVRVPEAAASGQPVRAPMAGTFYAGPEPGADAYVGEGQTVAGGDVLCIIESMKMMNEIKADRAGTCTAVRVANGHPVSAGDILFLIA